MLSRELLETQVAVELPAREMLGHNWAAVYTRQTNANLQFGVLNIQGGQANSSVVVIAQD